MTKREQELAEKMIHDVVEGKYLPRYVTIALDGSEFGWVSQETKEYIIKRVYEEV